MTSDEKTQQISICRNFVSISFPLKVGIVLHGRKASATMLDIFDGTIRKRFPNMAARLSFAKLTPRQSTKVPERIPRTVETKLEINAPANQYLNG